MTIDVIGAGLGRTGTLTLKVALEALGFDRCHHMIEVFEHPEQVPFWRRAADGDAVDWAEVFVGYRAAVDWPAAHFYRQIADYYPDARVVLTRRDPERWYDSISTTIFPALAAMVANMPPESPGRFSDIIITHNTFGGDLSKANVIAAYERHNAEVVRTIPPERLLVFEAVQGWAPLCAFLGVTVPDMPFPRTNSGDEFRARQSARNHPPAA